RIPSPRAEPSGVDGQSGDPYESSRTAPFAGARWPVLRSCGGGIETPGPPDEWLPGVHRSRARLIGRSAPPGDLRGINDESALDLCEVRSADSRSEERRVGKECRSEMGRWSLRKEGL